MGSLVISGKVIKGDGYGRVLGYPTANLDRRSFSRRKLVVRFGVYAGRAETISGRSRKTFLAAIVVGPFDRRGLPKLEAHLLDFHGDLYGQPLRLCLEAYLRPLKKFLDTQKLKQQIARDIARVNRLKYG